MCERSKDMEREKGSNTDRKKTERELHYFSFTHFSVVGHLSRYYNLAIIKCPVTNTDVRGSPLYITWSLLGKHQKVALLYYIIDFFVLKTFILIPIVVEMVYIPTAVFAKDYLFEMRY